MKRPTPTQRAEWAAVARNLAHSHPQAAARLQAAAEADELSETAYAIVSGDYWSLRTFGRYAPGAPA